jgi:hypothetical protein
MLGFTESIFCTFGHFLVSDDPVFEGLKDD